MSKLRVVVVGGFLGAGKTTLLAQAARLLSARGRRVGIVTNDQAAHLVDTRHLASLDIAVGEVAGGCFCCRFEDFENAANRLFAEVRPDMLLSEPVGSCMDISATVLQPIKRHWGEWAELSPFTVLADPRRLRQALPGGGDSGFPESVRYILRKQFEEADFIVINKTDLLSPAELQELKERAASAWRGTTILDISALQNRGVAEWLDAVTGAAGGGGKILDVDYDLYARGEAELGWLNATMTVTAREETDWRLFALDLIGRIRSELARRSAEVGNLKLFLENPAGRLVANAVGEDTSVRGGLRRSAGTATLVVNARACIEPDLLRSIVERSAADAAAADLEVSIGNLSSFSPAYPRPTHRFDSVIRD